MKIKEKIIEIIDNIVTHLGLAPKPIPVRVRGKNKKRNK